MNYNVELEGAGGMTHDEAGAVCFKLDNMGIDLRMVKKLIFEQREGWVGIIFKDGRESVIPGLIEKPSERKVFLPRAR